jgi:predicted N-acetyltransferase YhbS
MDFTLRPGRPEDAEACGAICFEAFRSISSEHNFPWDFPSAEIAIGLMKMRLAHRRMYSVVAERDSKVVGSNFLDERNLISGIGPISVDPTVQNRSIGRHLMLDVLERCAQRKVPGVRLLQSAYHNRSLCLYTKLGFDTRETISKLDGPPLGITLAGYDVRPATTSDLSLATPAAGVSMATIVRANSKMQSPMARLGWSCISARSLLTALRSRSLRMLSPRQILASRL